MSYPKHHDVCVCGHRYSDHRQCGKNECDRAKCKCESFNNRLIITHETTDSDEWNPPLSDALGG